MAVEDGDYICQLDPTLPLGTDFRNEGDNHLRELKRKLLNTFPNVCGEVTKTHEELNAQIGALNVQGFRQLSGDGTYLTISDGIAVSDDAVEADRMTLKWTLANKTTAAWVEGPEVGGKLETAAWTNDLPVAIWAIGNPTTGVTDIGFSQSFTAPPLPTGYTKKRLLGGWMYKTALVAGINEGRGYRFWESCLCFTDSFTASASPPAHRVYSIAAPPNTIVAVHTHTEMSGASGIRLMYSYRPIGSSLELFVGTEGNTIDEAQFKDEVYVDASSQLEFSGWAEGGTLAVDVNVYGWRFP